jgi:hypothetical protein
MFPFTGLYISERSISSLRIDQIVEVRGMVDPYVCMVEMFVEIKWH